MMIRTLLTAAAATALLAGGAHAGEGKKKATPAPAAAASQAPAASEMGTDSSSQTMSNPPVSADAMSAGVDTSATAANTRLITNGPVADTPENRAKFPPLSRAGRHTTPRGN